MNAETKSTSRVGSEAAPAPFVNKMLMNGALLRMASELLTALNDGNVKANSIIGDFIRTKMDVVTSLIAATTNSGLTNALGQELAGTFGIAGGVLGMAGGFTGAVSAAGHV